MKTEVESVPFVFNVPFGEHNTVFDSSKCQKNWNFVLSILRSTVYY